MELLQATDDFKINGLPHPGFPLLLYDSMESCRQANEFMRWYLRRGSIGSDRSWPSTGRALYDYFGFLQAHEFRWDDFGDDGDTSLLSHYRDYSLDTIGLHPNTVRQRLIYICAFYEFALRKRWTKSLPFDYEDRVVRRDGNFLQHVDASGGTTQSADVAPKQVKDLVSFLDRDQAKMLVKAATNPHHRMVIRFGLQTGLRRDEIASFPVDYVTRAAKAGGTGHYVRIALDPRDGTCTRTKGGKKREIHVSRTLVRDLHRYVKQVRGERAHLSSTSYGQLFLNQRGEPFASNGKGIERIVREIGQRVDIDVHPHMLRHTYATHTLYDRQRRRKAGVDPLVFVQKQLGHESIQTTMVYLHLVNALADDAVLEYDDELNDGWAA